VLHCESEQRLQCLWEKPSKAYDQCATGCPPAIGRASLTRIFGAAAGGGSEGGGGDGDCDG
jgi:hypothetical protein